MDFARRLERSASSPAGIFNPSSSWGCPAFLDFARRLGRSASSPAGIFSPSPRRAQPCPPGFCTPAGGVYFLSGGHSQPLSPWSCPPLVNFARRLEVSTSSLADILSPSPRGFSPPLPGFARRLGGLLPRRRTFSALLLVGLPFLLGVCTPAGGATSSPAGFLSPSLRGAALPS